MYTVYMLTQDIYFTQHIHVI